MANKLMQKIVLAWLITLPFISTATAERLSGCYEQTGLKTPANNINQALYIFIDQTMPLTASMRSNLLSIVEGHPKTGEMVRIARFSPNTKGQFTELLFEGAVDTSPSEEYLYHLRDEDHDALLNCLKENKQSHQEKFIGAFQKGLSMMDTKLPRTELFHALKRLSETVLVNDEIKDKTVLIISDGLENSEVASFYSRKTVGRIKPQQVITKLNQQNLITDWQYARIYMYGIGNINDEKTYVKPSQLAPLKEVWETYFSAGNGIIVDLGTPAVLSSQL